METGAAWQSSICIFFSSGIFFTRKSLTCASATNLLQDQVPRRFPPQRHFRSVHLEHPWVTSRGRTGSRNGVPGQKSHLHQALGFICRKLNMIQNPRFALFEGRQVAPRHRVVVMGSWPFETQLHPGMSILLCGNKFKG